MDSLIKWRGGKSRLAKKIVNLFPEHICYVEAFGGAAWVLFAKNPKVSKHEVLNDCHTELMNFWEIIKQIPNVMRFDIPSRFIYNKLREQKTEGLSEIERARRFYWMAMCSFGGTFGDVFGISRKGAAGYGFDTFKELQLNKRITNIYPKATITKQRFGILIHYISAQ